MGTIVALKARSRKRHAGTFELHHPQQFRTFAVGLPRRGMAVASRIGHDVAVFIERISHWGEA